MHCYTRKSTHENRMAHIKFAELFFFFMFFFFPQFRLTHGLRELLSLISTMAKICFRGEKHTRWWAVPLSRGLSGNRADDMVWRQHGAYQTWSADQMRTGERKGKGKTFFFFEKENKKWWSNQKKSALVVLSRQILSEQYIKGNRRIQIRLDDPIREISDLGRLRSDIERPTSDVGHPMSDEHHPNFGKNLSDLGRSRTWYRISDVQYRVSNVGYRVSDVRYRVLDVQDSISDEHLPDFGKNFSDLGRKTIAHPIRMSDPTKSEFT